VKLISAAALYLMFIGLLYLSAFYFYMHELERFSLVNLCILIFLTCVFRKYSGFFKLNLAAIVFLVMALYVTIYVKGSVSAFLANLNQVSWLFGLQLLTLLFVSVVFFVTKKRKF
jgi:hypothetical protein